MWFQSGGAGSVLCGAWQKMHISVVPVDRTVPVPLTERLCLLVGDEMGTCARTVDPDPIAIPKHAIAAASAAVAGTTAEFAELAEISIEKTLRSPRSLRLLSLTARP